MELIPELHLSLKIPALSSLHVEEGGRVSAPCATHEYIHEANIRGEGNIIFVIPKYLPKSLL
jgi:hypothetical protein